MTLKEAGYRKLGGLDIVRVGDIEWTKSSDTIPSGHNIVVKGDWIVGYQMQTEEMQSYGNNIFRKLNAPK